MKSFLPWDAVYRRHRMRKYLPLILLAAAMTAGCTSRDIQWNNDGRIKSYKSPRFGAKEQAGKITITNGKNPTIEIEAVHSDLVEGIKVAVQAAVETAIKASGVPSRGIPASASRASASRMIPDTEEPTTLDPVEEIEP